MPKPKTCEHPDCDNTFTPQRIGQKHCSPKCYYSDKPKNLKRSKINRVSVKRKKEQPKYLEQRRKFLKRPENAFCVVKGSNCTTIATTVEHSMGRKGYADDHKRSQGISLYLDQDYWLPCCLNCNLELENNPELSRKFQRSKIHGGIKLSKS